MPRDSLAALSSAHGPYLTQVLSMMVDKFTSVKPAEWTVPDFPEISRQSMRQRLHLGLQYILGVFPAARSILCGLIVSKYPYHEEPKVVHMAYIDNLLRLQGYAPDLERDVMELITAQMVKLDVYMQLDLDDADDEITRTVLERLAARSQGLNVGDEDEDESDAESVHSDDSDFEEEIQQIMGAEKSIRKLDAILATLFAFYSPFFRDPASADAADAFSKLLADFTNIILPTSKTRHSQFLLFHFGQKSPQLIDNFLGTLVAIAEDSGRPLVLRRAAIAYLAAFVARGARLPSELVQDIARTMWHKMDVYRANHEQLCRGPDLRRYALYYEWAQGLMYVFCFRWRDLVKSVPTTVDPDDPASYLDKDLVWMDDLRDAVRRNVRSKLNPLKVCSPSIVEQFANLALHLGLDYVFPLLDSNKNVHLSEFASSGYASGAALRDTGYDAEDQKWTHLEVNAQFDPYQLPQSKTWIEGDYISWNEILGLQRGGPADSDVDEHDTDDEIGIDDDDDELEENTATEDDA